MIRALRPTDALAYLAFRGQAPGNEALLGASGARFPPNLRGFFGQSLALEPRRETWIQIENNHIVGLVSAKARTGADVWNIDHLMAAPSADMDRVIFQLLEHLCRAAVEDGVEKVFLRVDDASPCLLAARQAGFFAYAAESIFSRTTTSVTKVASQVDRLRPRRPVDHLALFQLYSSTTPASERQIEGMTLQEWRWTEGWGNQRFGWRNRRDYVLPAEGNSLAAWLWLDLRLGTLRIVVDPRAHTVADALIRFGLSQIPAGQRLYVPVRSHQGGLEPILEEHEFECVGRHALLARALALRVPETKLVPVHVS